MKKRKYIKYDKKRFCQNMIYGRENIPPYLPFPYKYIFVGNRKIYKFSGTQNIIIVVASYFYKYIKTTTQKYFLFR